MLQLKKTLTIEDEKFGSPDSGACQVLRDITDPFYDTNIEHDLTYIGVQFNEQGFSKRYNSGRGGNHIWVSDSLQNHKRVALISYEPVIPQGYLFDSMKNLRNSIANAKYEARPTGTNGAFTNGFLFATVNGNTDKEMPNVQLNSPLAKRDIDKLIERTKRAFKGKAFIISVRFTFCEVVDKASRPTDSAATIELYRYTPEA